MLYAKLKAVVDFDVNEALASSEDYSEWMDIQKKVETFIPIQLKLYEELNVLKDEIVEHYVTKPENVQAFYKKLLNTQINEMEAFVSDRRAAFIYKLFAENQNLIDIKNARFYFQTEQRLTTIANAHNEMISYLQKAISRIYGCEVRHTGFWLPIGHIMNKVLCGFG